MTVLEEDTYLPSKSKLSLKTTQAGTTQGAKRKRAYQDDAETKKRPMLSENMLNGYRTEQKGSADVSQDSPVATLANMGNTCFLNSVLYTLRFAPTFLHNLHHLIGDLTLVSARLTQNKAKTSSLGRNVAAITGPSSRSTSSKDLLALGASNDLFPKTKVQTVTEKLHELYLTMHNLDVKEAGDPYQPVALLQAVKEANYIFEGNHQQDAHELLVYLLDNLRETCNVLMEQVQQNPDVLTETEIRPQSNHSKMWNVRRSWKKSQQKKDKNNKEPINEEQVNSLSTDTEDSCSVDNGGDILKKTLSSNFIEDEFQGITLRQTTCLECECKTERKEPFYDIPVPVKESEFENEMTSGNANEIYKHACKTYEKLCGSNKYLCEQCQKYNEATRDVLFEKLPNIMVLQLKRFTTSSSGVQKVNTYMPTPLELKCFCETCCKIGENESPLHRYSLCCVIMHLGASMASGHYISYVKAADHLEDYAECSRSIPKGSLSASSSEKSLNFLKFLKPKSINSLSDNKSIISSKNVIHGVRMCKSIDCCGFKLNRNVMENAVNSYQKRNGQDFSNEQLWLECDDENVRPITSQEFEDILSYKPNSTSTPYLLFYSKITEVA